MLAGLFLDLLHFGVIEVDGAVNFLYFPICYDDLCFALIFDNKYMEFLNLHVELRWTHIKGLFFFFRL